MSDLEKQVQDGIARLNLVNAAMAEHLKNAAAAEETARRERMSYATLKAEREQLSAALASAAVQTDVQKARAAVELDLKTAAEQRAAADKLLSELTASKAELDATLAAARAANDKPADPGTGETVTG
jgi:hypothetical protein